jgi:elongation factor P
LSKIITIMAKVSDISKGTFVRYNNELATVLEYEHRTPGNLRAFYQVKFRNLKTGKLIEQRFRPDENIEIVRIMSRPQQYLYNDGSSIVCMDPETFEQFNLPVELLGDSIKYLKENIMIQVSFEGEDAVYAEPPTSVEVEITYTENGIKGDTATRTLKPATIDTGAEIRVPLFLSTGDKVKINGTTGEYMERVK